MRVIQRRNELNEVAVTNKKSMAPTLHCWTAFIAVMLVVCTFALSLMLHLDDFYDVVQEHKRLYEDWTTSPFVDIVVNESAEGCPSGYEPVFSRTWRGTYDICKSANYTHSSYELMKDGDRCTGEKIAGLQPIEMINVGDKVICGKRGGPTFIESTRVDPSTFECP